MPVAPPPVVFLATWGDATPSGSEKSGARDPRAQEARPWPRLLSGSPAGIGKGGGFFRGLSRPACAALKGGATLKLGHGPETFSLDTPVVIGYNLHDKAGSPARRLSGHPLQGRCISPRFTSRLDRTTSSDSDGNSSQSMFPPRRSRSKAVMLELKANVAPEREIRAVAMPANHGHYESDAGQP